MRPSQFWMLVAFIYVSHSVPTWVQLGFGVMAILLGVYYGEKGE